MQRVISFMLMVAGATTIIHIHNSYGLGAALWAFFYSLLFVTYVLMGIYKKGETDGRNQRPGHHRSQRRTERCR
jgi:hypothetical protein